jgi:hypothetical protein
MKSGKVTRTLFVEAKDEIFKLMNMDSFQRFKRGMQNSLNHNPVVLVLVAHFYCCVFNSTPHYAANTTGPHFQTFLNTDYDE